MKYTKQKLENCGKWKELPSSLKDFIFNEVYKDKYKNNKVFFPNWKNGQCLYDRPLLYVRDDMLIAYKEQKKVKGASWIDIEHCFNYLVNEVLYYINHNLSKADKEQRSIK